MIFLLFLSLFPLLLFYSFFHSLIDCFFLFSILIFVFCFVFSFFLIVCLLFVLPSLLFFVCTLSSALSLIACLLFVLPSLFYCLLTLFVLPSLLLFACTLSSVLFLIVCSLSSVLAFILCLLFLYLSPFLHTLLFFSWVFSLNSYFFLLLLFCCLSFSLSFFILLSISFSSDQLVIFIYLLGQSQFPPLIVIHGSVPFGIWLHQITKPQSANLSPPAPPPHLVNGTLLPLFSPGDKTQRTFHLIPPRATNTNWLTFNPLRSLKANIKRRTYNLLMREKTQTNELMSYNSSHVCFTINLKISFTIVMFEQFTIWMSEMTILWTVFELGNRYSKLFLLFITKFYLMN